MILNFCVFKSRTDSSFKLPPSVLPSFMADVSFLLICLMTKDEFLCGNDVMSRDVVLLSEINHIK